MQIAGRGEAFEEQEIVANELRRCPGLSAPGKIIGRGDERAANGTQPDREERAVGQFGDSDGNIHAFFRHPHEAIGQQQAQSKLWVIPQETGKDWAHVHPAEDSWGCQYQ